MTSAEIRDGQKNLPLIRAAPVVFVLLWSTGFIGARMGAPYAEPMTFLSLRFGFAAAILLPIAFAVRAPWPKSWREAGHYAVAGLLIQGVYLGAVFASIDQGVQAAVASLIVSTQPLWVAALAGVVLGERVTARQWLGLALGLAGVTLVVWNKLDLGIGTPVAMMLSVLGLAGITAGTLYQKRFGQSMNLITGSIVQFIVSGAVVIALAFLIETREVEWAGEFIFALSWLTVVMSIGVFMLLWILIRRGAATKVSSLFFLVPGMTAVIAYFLFGDTFEPTALIGMAVTMVGVALANLGDRSAKI